MTRMRRVWMWLALIGSGATLFQTSGYYSTYGNLIGNSGGCARFASNGLASSIDFCYLLDCDNGFLGGVFDPCNDPTTSLVDCANTGATTTTNATNATTTTP